MTARVRALPARLGRHIDPAAALFLAILAALAVFAPDRLGPSLGFTGDSLWGVAPFLAISVALAAYARASGADAMIARAFAGSLPAMIVVAALFGALSPFCSCGVIPVIAALLAMGVPLAPVMAFWLSSPLMDPSMFVLTIGTLGMDFALWKTVAAVAMGLIGGFGTLAMTAHGAFAQPLAAGVGDGGCAAASIRQQRAVDWRPWRDPARRGRLLSTGSETLVFLGKWLALAYLLESLMLAWIPAERVAAGLGGDGIGPVLLATVVGVPAYLNGYAALPLVGGLVEQGMSPGAGMAFLLAGGVSSVPAAIAVFALTRLPVFLAYLGFALVGSAALGLAFGALS